MERVIIHIARESLTDIQADPQKEYRWSSLDRATIGRAAPALFDELSIIFETVDGQV